jgi:hypothetical protein
LTAKIKHGHKAHRRTLGADEGSPHERLNRQHAMPNRPEGAPMSAASQPNLPPSPVPQAPPMGGGASAAPMAPPGAGPDDEESSQS